MDNGYRLRASDFRPYAGIIDYVNRNYVGPDEILRTKILLAYNILTGGAVIGASKKILEKILKTENKLK